MTTKLKCVIIHIDKSKDKLKHKRRRIVIENEIIQEFKAKINGVNFKSALKYFFTMKTLENVEMILGKEISPENKEIVNTVSSFYENMQENLNISFKEIVEITEYGFNNAGEELTIKDFECYDPCLLNTEENETLKEIFEEFSSMINKL